MSNANDRITPPEPPKVSVCVITYNHAKYIARCLQSIVDQETDFRFEIVVGEDHSTDGTLAIVEEFASRHPDKIRLLSNPTNLGGMGNYRLTHGSARGELIAHCDGDDYWQPGKLAAQVGFLDHRAQCSAVFTNSLVITEDGRASGLFSRNVVPLFDTGYLIEKGNFLHHSSLMYRSLLRSSVMPDTGNYIDFEVYVRLSRLGPLGFIDQPLTTYRDQSGTSVVRGDRESIRRLYWQALREAADGATDPVAVTSAHAHFLSGIVRQALVKSRMHSYRQWAAIVREAAPDQFSTVRRSAWQIALTGLAARVAQGAARRLGLVSPASKVYYPR